MSSPPLIKTHKFVFLTQIFLRILAIAATFAAAWLTITSKETTVVYGIQVDARYSYSPAFKFLALANLIAFGFSVLSLFLVFIAGRKAVNPTYYFYIFLHDLAISLLLIAGCAAATAIAYVGKYGNSHTGWMAICDHFAKFCNRVKASAMLSYLAFAFYLILTIISACNSRRIIAS
ncbi:hypothetical protein BUALT_Bualt02G0092900 [Buddleja alternifolia]|uniref:CASP-like protein n=1 Tax=Buddleja alternifolia TaxID=168488 RepID=A0AAV6Y526_9LAMI|nr:hypothetical protein BUALT_Bualt02G0092900 [Buddleja alternifolia]